MAKVIEDVRYDITPPEQWPEDQKASLTIRLLYDVGRSLTHNVERAIKFADIVRQHELWKCLQKSSYEELLAEHDLTEEAIEQYRLGVALLRGRGHLGPISKDEARRAAVAEQKEAAKTVSQGTRTDLTSLNVKEVDGNSNDHVLRRLARDGHDDLLDAIEAGELTVNQAAIKAGYRKKLSAAEQCVKAFRKSENKLEPLRVIVQELEDYERQVLKDWLDNGI